MLQTAAIDQRQAAAPSRGRAGEASGDAFALLLGGSAAADSAPPAPRTVAERPAKPAPEVAEAKPQAPHQPKAPESDGDAAGVDGDSVETASPGEASMDAASPDGASHAATTASAPPLVAVTSPAANATVNAGPNVQAGAEAAPADAAPVSPLPQAAPGGQAQTAPTSGQGETAANQPSPAVVPDAKDAPQTPVPQASQPQPGPVAQPAPTTAAATAAQPSPEPSTAGTLPVQAPATGKPRTASEPASPGQGKTAAGTDQKAVTGAAATFTPPATPATSATPGAPTGQPAAAPAQTATAADPATAADADVPELPAAPRNGAAAQQGSTGSGAPNGTANQGAKTGGQADASGNGTTAGKPNGQQTTAQRAEALAERLAGTTAAERNFQAYLQRASDGRVQSAQAPVADDAAPQPLPAQQQAANAADAPLSAAAARPAPTAPGTQVAVQIHSALTSRLQRFSIRLEPAELGRVDVRLDFHRDGQVRATIAAERPETLDLLQKDVHSLERALRDAGTNTAKLSFNFDLQGGGRQGAGHDGGRTSGSDGAADGASESDELAADPAMPGRRIDGLIDIRV